LASAIGLLGFFYIAIAALGNRKPLAVIFFAVATGGVLLAPLTLRTTGSLRAATSQLLLSILGPVLLLAATTTGFAAPELVWLAVIPLIAAAVSGRRFAIAWCGIALAGIVALSILWHLRLIPIPESGGPWTRAGVVLSFGSVLCVVLWLALALDQARSETRQALAQAKTELAQCRSALYEHQTAAEARVQTLTHRLNNPLQHITSNIDYLTLVLSRPRPNSALTAAETEELKAALQDLRRGVEQIRDVVREIAVAPLSPS
jgi:hypothetical protein